MICSQTGRTQNSPGRAAGCLLAPRYFVLHILPLLVSKASRISPTLARSLALFTWPVMAVICLPLAGLLAWRGYTEPQSRAGHWAGGIQPLGARLYLLEQPLPFLRRFPQGWPRTVQCHGRRHALYRK